MNILFINIFFVGFILSEIPRVSVLGHCPYSVTFLYMKIYSSNNKLMIDGNNQLSQSGRIVNENHMTGKD